ncbi:ester cyclase [Rhizosphaericola mali]|uniref:Ester cyclase n=1 Tax=Rhizosphaericola mali TaxID=2545455 RepID=A0A5P2FX92_9BACT|nr:ester cyclase [Rhizosphaericola mali]QES88134.1 ester cyclase [Rhizosphaericola mali]
MSKLKEIVIRFNKEVIEAGNHNSFSELIDPNFINHSAPLNSQGPEGMIYTFNHILRPAISQLTVTILQQIEEEDLVTTRKQINGILTGQLFDVQPTNQPIKIDIIDIVRIKDGRYFEHWGLNTLSSIVAQLKDIQKSNTLD